MSHHRHYPKFKIRRALLFQIFSQVKKDEKVSVYRELKSVDSTKAREALMALKDARYYYQVYVDITVEERNYEDMLEILKTYEREYSEKYYITYDSEDNLKYDSYNYRSVARFLRN